MPIKDSNNLILEKMSNSKELQMSKEKTEINFDSLLQDLKDSENEAIRARIETYELKGFNAMEPTIKNNNEAKLELTHLDDLLENQNIDSNHTNLMKITEKDLKDFNELHYIKIKPKENNFEKILIDSCEINKYGNINLLNCIYMLTKKDKNYFKNLFTKFDLENFLFQYKYYQSGQENIILLNNKVLKNTMFIKPDESNFFIYLIEKTIAKIYKHYLNTYNLLASDCTKI